MFALLCGLFVVARGLFAPFRGLFVVVCGLFVVARGLFAPFRGLFVVVCGLFVVVCGLFVVVCGLFVVSRGALQTPHKVVADRFHAVLAYCRERMVVNYTTHFEDKRAFQRFIDEMVGAKKALARSVASAQDAEL